MIQVIDDCIKTAQQNEIKNYFFKDLPWYYKEDVTLGNGVENGRPALDHWFYEKGKNVSNIKLDLINNIVRPFNKTIHNCKSILQLPLNNLSDPDISDIPHVDMDEKHLVIIYYVCTSDGNTIIKTKDSPVCVKPKQGRIVIFDGKYEHTAEQPRKNKRCIINYNLI